jgi:hypothetical protein
MLRKLRNWFYSLFIIHVVFVTKKRASDFRPTSVFATVKVGTTDGKSIKFTFKTEARQPAGSLFLKYIVECEVDDTFSKELQELNSKVLISITVIRFGFLKPNYKVLADLLLNMYIHSATKYMQDLQNSKTAPA